MIGWPNLPYEVIGRGTVLVLAVLALLALALVAFIALYAVWYRGLSLVIDLCWSGYEPAGEHPPKWRRLISVYALGLKMRDMSQARYVHKEMEDLKGRDTDE